MFYSKVLRVFYLLVGDKDAEQFLIPPRIRFHGKPSIDPPAVAITAERIARFN